MRTSTSELLAAGLAATALLLGTAGIAHADSMDSDTSVETQLVDTLTQLARSPPRPAPLT
jgi:hypothetical protein